ncbi:hypothetical protein [Methanofollis sp. UBA420]|uniref:hypothetical protein n=1 Tax=Methanofollis sp. UBA420 TaxID=1915514 RepID=UPI00316AE4E7
MVEIYDEEAPNFTVSSLDDVPKEDITFGLPDPDDPASPAADGAVYGKVHTESDYKYEYVFYVRDLAYLDTSVERLLFVAEGDDGTYPGLGLIKVTQTRGGGGRPDNTGGGGSGHKGGRGK